MVLRPLLAATLLLAAAAPALAQETPSRADVYRVGQTCKTDIQTHCAEVPRGGGRILTCLNERRDQLTAECDQALVDLEARMNGTATTN
jgi:hypothetical protein